MARKIPPPPTLEQAVAGLRQNGFETQPAPNGAFSVRKHGCSAALGSAPWAINTKHSRAVVVEHPAVLLGGLPAQLVDCGYQKFLVAGTLKVAATAEKLSALHQFQEELAQAIGRDQIYNEALGTVSDAYLYDRVRGRADIQP